MICFNEKERYFFDSVIHQIENEIVEIGKKVIVHITVIKSYHIDSYLKVGTTFSLNEPPIQIGEGEILEVL